jgi:hypothetical protein
LSAPIPGSRRRFASLQGKIDWGVDWDTTWIHFEIPPAGVETALEIIGRLMVIESIRPRLSRSKWMKSSPGEIKLRSISAWLKGRTPLLRADNTATIHMVMQ